MIQKETRIGNLTTRPYLPVLPGHFWIGSEYKPLVQSSWFSYTGRFNPNEISSVQNSWENQLDKIVDVLLASDPIVTLRALTEIMFNSGYDHPETKFDELLKNEKLSEHWAKFLTDRDVDDHDRGHAITLLKEIYFISEELMKAQTARMTEVMS